MGELLDDRETVGAGDRVNAEGFRRILGEIPGDASGEDPVLGDEKPKSLHS